MLVGWVCLAIFVAAYVLFVVFPHHRTGVCVAGALLAAGVLMATRTAAPAEVLMSINWNVMGIFVGTMAVADVFMDSRVPAYLAETIVDRSPNTTWAMLFICLLTSVLSAFVENVATVMIVAPIALALARKLAVNPVRIMVAMAISSNLQGAATLIGDPPSMLLGGFARMDFLDFFVYHGKPGIFFAVEIGALASFVFLFLLFRKDRHEMDLIPVERVRSWTPTVLLVLLILLLAATSLVDEEFSYAAGGICVLFGALSVAWKKLVLGGPIGGTLRAYDWESTLFLAGVFVMVGSITATGWIDRISFWLTAVVGGDALAAYVLVVVLSVVFSAFIDNVPYLATMLPVAMQMAGNLGVDPPLLLFGLLIGASLGGNITPIGASANIVACGILKKEGIHIRFGEFVRIGLPFTLVATLPACLFVWAVWR